MASGVEPQLRRLVTTVSMMDREVANPRGRAGETDFGFF